MYYDTAHRLFQDVAAQLTHVDRTAVHRHPRVITEDSCAKKKVYSKDEDHIDAATSQYQAYNTSHAVPLTAPSSSYGGAAPPLSAYGPPGGGSYGLAPPAQQPVGYGGPPSPAYGAPPGGPSARPHSLSGGGAGRPLPAPRPSAAAPAGHGAPQAKALYPFQAQDPQELGFNPGDVLTVHKQNGDWWEAELHGRRGLIPANYVQLL